MLKNIDWKTPQYMAKSKVTKGYKTTCTPWLYFPKRYMAILKSLEGLKRYVMKVVTSFKI